MAASAPSGRSATAASTSTTSCPGSRWPSSPAAARSSAATSGWRRWLALPFGAGVALTLDESALLLKLDDVYWTEEGIVSVQITFAALAMLSALALALRTLRRGERTVLPDAGDDVAQDAWLGFWPAART